MSVENPFYSQMIDAEFPGRETIKLTLAENPEIIIRSNPEDEMTWKFVIDGRKELNALRKYNIHVPRFDIVQGQDFYTVTQRVHGEDLITAFTKQGPELLTKYEKVCSGLIAYLWDRRILNSSHLEDAYHPDQYMYGFLKGNPNPEIYLVDLDFHTAAPSESDSGLNLWEFGWLSNLRQVTDGILIAERLSGSQLNSTRQHLSRVISELPNKKTYNKARKIFKNILKSGESIESDEWAELLLGTS